MGRRRALAVTLAVLLVAEVAVGGGVALVAATPGNGGDHPNGGPPGQDGKDHPHGGPPGHNGVPSGNVEVGGQNGQMQTQGGGPPGGLPDSVPSHAAAWGVHASDHAADLEVGIEVGDDGRLRMVLSDDVNHAGREVAVNASALEQALGYVPDEVDGVHESGDEWTSPLRVDDGMAVFDVPRFSTNTVTFDGEVVLDGSEATDGATYEYDLEDASAATDPQGTLTGVEVAEWDNASASGLGDGDTLAVDPAGHEVRGPAGGEPEVVFEGEEESNSRTESGTALAGTSASIGIDGNLDPEGPVDGNPELSVNASRETTSMPEATNSGDSGVVWSNSSNPPSYIEEVFYSVTDAGTATDDYGTIEVYVDGNLEASQEEYVFGDNVNSDTIQIGSEASSSVKIRFESPGQTSYTQTIYSESEARSGVPSSVTVSGDDGTSAELGDFADGETKTTGFDLSNSASSLSFSSATGGSFDWTLDYNEVTVTADPALDLDNDGTAEVSHAGLLHEGEIATYQASSLDPSDGTATVSTDGGSTVGVDVRLQEIVETRNPEVDVNGEQVASHSGTLADGETVEFAGDATSLQNGTNSVDISVGDGSLSADAPTPAVGFTYSHSATFDQQVGYSGETWSETYDINRTWDAGVTNATLTVPFEGNVVAMRDLTVYQNGSETEAEWSRFVENSTTLEVGFGDVAPDTTTRVVANGSKVRVGGGGEIAVREPTVMGDGLDTEVELLEWTDSSYLEVSETRRGEWTHHTASESWDTPETFATVDSSGGQTLHLPGAVSGSTTRVRTVPVEVTPESGGVEVAVLEAAVDTNDDGATDSPRFRVREGDAAGADTVEIGYHDTQSGETYELFSETDEQGVDTAEAESPVWFTTSGDAATYVVRPYEASSSDPPPVVASEDDSSGESPFGSLLVLAGVVAGILAFWYVGRRFTGARGFTDNYLLLAGGGATALVGVSAVGGGSAWSALERAASTPAGAVVGALAAMLALQRFDEWTGWVPTLAKAAAALGLGFWVLQVLTDGALSSGVEQVAPFLVVLGVVVFAVLAWRALSGPTINIRGGGS